MLARGLILTALLMLASPASGRAAAPVNDVNTTLSANDVLRSAWGSPKDPNASSGGGSGLEQLFKVVTGLMVVLALALLLAYGGKRWLPALSQSTGKEIQVVETIGLGPRKALHLVRVGSQQLLIGSTADRIVALTDIRTEFGELVQSQMMSQEDAT